MKLLSICVLLSLALSICIAADEPKQQGPKSGAAINAIAKHEKTLSDAASTYQQVKTKADAELVAALKKAQADAMKAGGANALAESNAIQAVIDKTSATAAHASTDTAALRERLIGTKWLWVDNTLGDRGWFIFNEDGTLEVGWHNKPTIWTASTGGRVLTKIGEANVIYTLTFNPELTAGEAKGDNGNRQIRRLK